MPGYSEDGSSGAPGSIRGRGPNRIRRLIVRTMTADKQLTTLPGLLLGWSMRETTGGAGAVVELYDGGGTTGEFAATIGNGNGVASTVWLGPEGVEIENGVFAHVVTGSMDVIVFFRADMQGA